MSDDPRYKSHQWRKVRRSVLERDGFQCQLLGEGCTSKADECDHVISPIFGGSFYDPANLRASCRHCNRARGARERNRHGWKYNADTRIALVAGPPCGGKTTYVQRNAIPGDLIVDLDLIAVAIGSPDTHDHPPELVRLAQKLRGELLSALRQGKTTVGKAWVVSANPAAPTMFAHHELIRCVPSLDECLARNEQRNHDVAPIIRRWFAEAPANLLDGVSSTTSSTGGGSAPSRRWS